MIKRRVKIWAKVVSPLQLGEGEGEEKKNGNACRERVSPHMETEYIRVSFDLVSTVRFVLETQRKPDPSFLLDETVFLKMDDRSRGDFSTLFPFTIARKEQ